MPETTTVSKGESWASIAKRLYGDERMMGELMRANGGTLNLKPGQKLVIPNKVDNPFVSFAQAAYGAGTLEESKPGQSQRTADYISELPGGAEWLAKAAAAMGRTGIGQTPSRGGRGSMLPTAAGYAQLRDRLTPANLSPQQAAMRGRSATVGSVYNPNAPAQRAAQENAGVYSNVPANRAIQENTITSQYNKPSSFPSQPKGTTRYSPGQQTAQPLTAGPSFDKNAWFMKGATPVPAIAGAIGGFSTLGANAPDPRTAQLAPANPTPGAQPVNQPTAPTSRTATGGNNLSRSETDSWEQNVVEAQQIAVELQGDFLPRKVYSNNGIVRAIAMSGIPAEDAQELAVKTMENFGWTRQGGMWLPPTPGVDDAVPGSGTGTLDFRNMDISTLVQLGFYDAPTQPTFSNSGRSESGGSQPAPYSLVGGTSWRVNP
jgi:hypothetical protein